jgi:cytidylate kinase
MITISRQMGSGGDEIAEILAARLGWRCLNRHIIERAARKSGAPEAALAMLDELNMMRLRPTPEAQLAHRLAVEQAIRDAAREGQVIVVGRGGQVVLRHQAETFHIKIVSPPDARVQRLISAARIDEEAAVNRIAASDRSRANYLRKEYGANWVDPLLYDLVINVGLGKEPWAVNLIHKAIETEA